MFVAVGGGVISDCPESDVSRRGRDDWLVSERSELGDAALRLRLLLVSGGLNWQLIPRRVHLWQVVAC